MKYVVYAGLKLAIAVDGSSLLHAHTGREQNLFSVNTTLVGVLLGGMSAFYKTSSSSPLANSMISSSSIPST